MDRKEKVNEFLKIAKDIQNNETRKAHENNFFHKQISEDEETIKKANALIIDIENTPHAFVLGCIMDKQIQAEKAWIIPYKILTHFKNNFLIEHFSIDNLSNISLNEYETAFREASLHRFNKKMAKQFRDGVLRIKNRYNSDASRIWSGKPSSKTVVERFEEFNGVGQKISTMATNILFRKFGIEFSEYSSIDISLDVHVLCVMRRLGLVENNIDNEIFKNEVLSETRRWNPEYPGIFDRACFEVGRSFCFEDKTPNCKNCILQNICDKVF
jgi:endonuclease III